MDDKGLVVLCEVLRYICATRPYSAPMMVGIIAKLRRGFEYVGGKGVYNPITLQGGRAMFALGFASITNLNGLNI